MSQPIGETPFIESNLLLAFQSEDLEGAAYWLAQMSKEEARRFEALLDDLARWMNRSGSHGGRMSRIIDWSNAKRTPAQVLKALIDLMDSVELTDAEVDEELRARGYDPEKLGKHFARIAAIALYESHIGLPMADWLNLIAA